jgi:glutamate 5-kinase
VAQDALRALVFGRRSDPATHSRPHKNLTPERDPLANPADRNQPVAYHAVMAASVNLVRREIIATAKTLVVKIGTNVLSKEDDTLDDSRFEALAAQIHAVRQSGRRVVLVSSGAIGAGIGLLGLQKRPDDLPHLQAAAAVGQAHLIHRYDDALKAYGYHAAQLLLTANDFRRRARYLNVRNTLRTLFEYNAIPIINENDTVSVDEIRFGDNDRLAAFVTNLLESPLLVILSVIDGLYSGDPADPASKLISLVENWDESLLDLATVAKSKRGTGGMQSKLEAARTATAVGESVIIANGREPDVLPRILAAEEIGTLFLAKGESIPAWKRWIGYSLPPRGRFVLDDGARKAIAQRGRSLLAIGIVEIDGDFSKGEVVSLVDKSGVEFARGLTNFGAHDARRIAGKRTEQIAEILGSLPYDEVIHCDNLVVTA